MSSELPVLEVEHIGKRYQIYAQPADRLWQFFSSLVQRCTGRQRPALFRDFHALQDVSFRVYRGESVGIIGRNGSGKSSLLQLICGTLHPSCGQVTVQGRIAALLELGAGFNPDFTGRENVFLNASVLGLSREETLERFDAIAAFADIGEHLDQAIRTYSSGMVVRLAFAVIAHVDADILIIDEALAVGDALFTQKCMRFLRDFMQDRTVVFVSHDIEGLKALCRRVIWIDKGRVVRDGTTKEVCQQYLDFLFTGQTGAIQNAHSENPKKITVPRERYRDARLDFINASSLRNDIQVLPFDPAGAGLGSGGATIRDAKLRTESGQPLSWVVGGEAVELSILVECHVALASPIIGFMVKDRTGQALFGDNTWLSNMDAPLVSWSGQFLEARFAFEMPRLPAGDYSTVVAIVEGNQLEGLHQHWLHDALHFRSECSSVVSGLVGLPMRSIHLAHYLPPPTAD